MAPALSQNQSKPTPFQTQAGGSNRGEQFHWQLSNSQQSRAADVAGPLHHLLLNRQLCRKAAEGEWTGAAVDMGSSARLSAYSQFFHLFHTQRYTAGLLSYACPAQRGYSKSMHTLVGLIHRNEKQQLRLVPRWRMLEVGKTQESFKSTQKQPRP